MTTQPSASSGRKRVDLTGIRIGMVTVIEFAGKRRRPSGQYSHEWLCRCDCGKTFRADGACIRRKSTKSCGCDWISPTKSHGKTDHPLYVVWCGIKSRCFNKTNPCYSYYGGRGITMCERWRNSFATFLDDMGERPSATHTIERINNDGNYEPGNCKWATRAEQNENTKQTRLLTLDGITLSIGKWAKRLGVDRKTLTCRLARGWSVERTLRTPPLKRGLNAAEREERRRTRTKHRRY